MTVYLSEPIEVDRAAIKQTIVDDLQTRIPGLEVAPGTLLDYLCDGMAGLSAEDRQLLTDQLAIAFRYYGEKILRIPQRDAVAATGTATITATDTVGHTIPAGFQLTLAGLDSSRKTFATVGTTTIAPGSSTTGAGAVSLVAVVAGSDSNGLSSDAQPEETLAWLNTITIVGTTSGGSDAEDDDTYLDRLADTTPLSGFTLVLPENFERAARTLLTDGGRALAIDRYDPGPPADPDVDKTMTVALVDGAGADYGSTFRDAVQAVLEAAREVGFQVFVIAPTYTDVDIVFAGVSQPGFDTTDVESRAEAAVLDFIDPANHGLPATGDQRLWIDTPVVRFQDVSAVLNGVEGFDHWTSLTLNGGTSDVVLAGPAALPSPTPASSVNGTVVVP